MDKCVIWSSGLAALLEIESKNRQINISISPGELYLLHKEIVESVLPKEIYVVNHFDDPYKEIRNLYNLTTDASGESLNNRSFSLVLGLVWNKKRPPVILLNLPGGSYPGSSPKSAHKDKKRYSVYKFPHQFNGVSVLLSRFILTCKDYKWKLYMNEDLRGKSQTY